MSPEEQRKWYDAEMFREGIGEPFEFKIREIAKTLAHDDRTYKGGMHVPFRLTGRYGYTDVHVHVIPGLESDPDRAQLLIEKIIKEALA